MDKGNSFISFYSIHIREVSTVYRIHITAVSLHCGPTQSFPSTEYIKRIRSHSVPLLYIQEEKEDRVQSIKFYCLQRKKWRLVTTVKLYLFAYDEQKGRVHCNNHLYTWEGLSTGVTVTSYCINRMNKLRPTKVF